MKYYLIKAEDNDIINRINDNGVVAKGMECVKQELTPDDYGLILDALYEQANQQEQSGCSQKIIDYTNGLRKVAKKLEKIFGGSND